MHKRRGNRVALPRRRERARNGCQRNGNGKRINLDVAVAVAVDGGGGGGCSGGGGGGGGRESTEGGGGAYFISERQRNFEVKDTITRTRKSVTIRNGKQKA